MSHSTSWKLINNNKLIFEKTVWADLKIQVCNFPPSNKVGLKKSDQETSSYLLVIMISWLQH